MMHFSNKFNFKKLLLKAEVYALQTHFAHATRFLKRTLSSHPETQAEKDLPWYLVLGPTQSGKTTLLSHAELNFIGTDQFVQRFAGDTFSSTTCNWWLSTQGVFLDVPGHFINQESEKSTTAWVHLVNLIKKHTRRHSLKGVLLILNIYDIAKESHGGIDLDSLQKKLLMLQHKLKQPLPIHLVLTQCDRIQGFNEFFADLGPGERQTFWGFSLQDPAQEKSHTDFFNQEFDQFLKRLNQRLIWRLHHERNLDNKFIIKDFPAQLEMLKGTLTKLIYHLNEQLAAPGPHPVHGLYFCSGTQKGEPIDKLIKTFTTTHTINPPLVMPATLAARPFFIHQFFTEIVLGTKPATKQKTKTISKTPLTGYALVLIPPVLACMFWIQNDHQQKTQLTLAVKSYGEYQTLSKKDSLSPTQLLKGLDELQNALFYLEHFQPSLGTNKINAKKNLEKNTHTAYTTALTDRLIPQISSIFAQKLLAADKAHPEQAYSLLKNYLMLADPKHLEITSLHQWIQDQGPLLLGLTPDQLEQYYFHLTQALTMVQTMPPLNQAAIEHARHLLDDMPYPLLAYALIKTNFSDQPLTLFQDPNLKQVFHFADDNFNFSQLYTATKFSNIYNELIPTMSREVSTGNWILGRKAQQTLSQEEVNDLTQEVKDLYLTDYLNNWKKLINNIQLREFSNFAESYTLLAALAGNSPALEDLIQTVTNNMSLSALTKNNDNANNKFFTESLANENVDAWSKVAANQALLHSTTLVLGQLASDIHNVVASIHPDAAALSLAQHYMQAPQDNPITLLLQLSATYPEPIKGWLESIAYGNWKLILDSAYQAIKTEWKNTISPFYMSNLHQRYPFAKQTPLEVKSEDFKHFFSPQGLLANFFNQNLKPFIVTDKMRWKFLKVAGMGLPLSDEILEQFERGSIISRMYFPLGNDEMEVHFFLQPMALMPGLKNITIRYSGKEIVDIPPDGKLSTWTWPPTNKDADVTVEFVSNEGQSSTLSQKGDWAWFRLFEKAHIQQTLDPKKFDLTFDSNGNAAKYILLTNTAINPFIPGIVEQFKFPEKL